MTPFTRTCYIAFTLAMLVLGCTLTQFGIDWLEIGYGINPWLAFPLALLVLLAPIPVGYWLIDADRQLMEEIREHFGLDENFTIQRIVLR